jgi:hypothetical protein
VIVSFRTPSLFYLFVHSRCGGFLFSLDHTQTHSTVGRTPLDKGSAGRGDLYVTTQTLYKRQTSMSPVGFETTIPARARPPTYALDLAATGVTSTIRIYVLAYLRNFSDLIWMEMWLILQGSDTGSNPEETNSCCIFTFYFSKLLSWERKIF